MVGVWFKFRGVARALDLMVPEAISEKLEPMQQRLVACYEEPRDPDKLDCLVYNVDRLHRILLELNTCSSEQVRSSGSRSDFARKQVTL